MKEVRAIKHIARGEEITMSYIENNWDIHANRYIMLITFNALIFKSPFKEAKS